MIRTIILALALVVGACGGKKDDKGGGGGGGGGSANAGSATAKAGSDGGSGSAAGSADSGSGSAAPEVALDVPSEVEFEDDAKTRITEASLAAEVEKLEKELNDTGGNAP